MARHIQVIFQSYQCDARTYSSDGPMLATAGVWIDLDDLRELIKKAARNKSRRSKDGCIHVEIHTLNRGGS